MQEIPRKILYLLIVLTILGEIFSIIMWTVNPTDPFQGGQDPRFVLIVGYEIAVLNAVIMVPLNLLALYLIVKRIEWGPLYFIAISIGNRIASQFFFDSGMHGIFISWTILIVFFAYYVYHKLNKIEILSVLAGAVSGFPVFYYVFWATINEVIATLAWALVIAAWILAVKLITKK